MNRQRLESTLRTQYEIAARTSQKSVRGFLTQVVIDSRPEPRRFGDIADPWQWDCYLPIGDALEYVAGVRETYTGPMSFWRGLPRGYDKTSSIARLVIWVAAFSRRKLRGAVAAGDADQARLVLEAVEAQVRLNPWLEGKVRVYRNVVYGPGGSFKVLSADAPSSFGRTDDIYITDELTHWKKRDLFDVLWSGREKRSSKEKGTAAVFIVISNAGTTGSWQHNIYRNAQGDHTWNVWEAPPRRHLASWMSPAAIDRMRRLLPRGMAKRVIDNVWIDAAEEADFLSRKEVELCEARGTDLGLRRQVKASEGQRYVASIDYGPRRDRTCLAVGHKDKERDLVIVDRLDVWQGNPEAPVQIAQVEEWVEQTIKDFPGCEIICDPYQLEGTVQKYEGNHRIERFEARGGKSNYEMAENLRSLISSGKITWYPGAGSLPVDGRLETLGDELMQLVLKVTPYGYRFDHEANYHDDRAVAVGMMALRLEQMDPSGPGVPPQPVRGKETEGLPQQVALRRPEPAARWTQRGLWGARR
jgi:hypothetical protein